MAEDTYSYKGWLVSDSTLKRLVLEHIYMFDIEHNKKHSICKKIDISSESSTKAMLTQLKK